MGEKYKDYKDLVSRLREYSDERKGEISKLTYDAAKVISILITKLEILEKEIEGEGDDIK